MFVTKLLNAPGRNIFLIHLLVLILTDIQKELITKLRF